MAYQVLARKWRPQDFSGVVGQEPIVTALRNALSEGRVAQAYLFSGIRGVGKTSVARVLAKALNCERGPAADPCNECDTCRDITAGSDLDVIEVDAATYSKVEQVRELTESLKYGPAKDRSKVVVIDEVHRLSRQAFDALLKIVEEPPPHLVFIFATTEIDAVPATILSRCQEFHFRRVRPAMLASYLRRLADEESITVSETGLRLIARAGEGSVRDSVALLDQLATYGSGTIQDDDAARILGGVDTTIHHRLLASIIDGLGDEIVAVVREIEDAGWDPRHVYGEFLTYCRDALHLALAVDPKDTDLPEEAAIRLAEIAQQAGYENLLRLLNLLLESENIVRRSDAGTLAVEIAWLRAAELPKLVRIEDVIKGAASTASPAPAGRRSPSRAAVARSTQKPQEASGRPSGTTRRGSASPETEGAPATADGEPEDPTRQLIETISQKRQALAAHLAEARSLSFEDGVLVIRTTPGDTWLSNALQRESNRQILESCLASIWGEGSRWRLLEAPAERDAGAQSVGVADPVLEHPVVQTALDIFGGRARTVESEES